MNRKRVNGSGLARLDFDVSVDRGAPVDFRTFARDNAADPELVRAVMRLQPGEVLRWGGGGAARATIRRLHSAAKRNGQHPATAADFARWQDRAFAMSAAELHYSIADAVAAMRAMRGVDPIAEARYADEAHTYQDELRRRQAK